MDVPLRMNAERDTGPLFLCHNSLDKAVVKQIADALELESGTTFFLDTYAIPTGERFLPWIEQELAAASGCAIFLGASGWGQTHLWEAERALERYRSDPNFRIIPVALPGVAEEDMRRLGSGKVFQEINWADFRAGVHDSDALAKLLAGLRGERLPQHRAPARLTPYQMRRDAARWHVAASSKEKRSILYRGAQLASARRLVENNPDFVVLDEVLPFLAAAEAQVRRQWRRMAVASVALTALFLTITVAAVIGYILAEERRLASLSRALATIARDAPAPDQRLLIGVEGYLASPTPEARATLVSLLSEWAPLRRVIHADTSVEAVALAENGHWFAAAENGGILRIPTDLAAPAVSVAALRSEGGSATAIALFDGRVFVGRGDGGVDVVGADGSVETALRPEPFTGGDRRILTLAVDPHRSIVAAGSGSGRLSILDAYGAAPPRVINLSDELRVRALSFDAFGRRLAVGTGGNRILLFDTENWEIMDVIPRIEGGVLALAFTQEGDLIAVSGYGLMTRQVESPGGWVRRSSHQFAGLFSAAAISAEAGLVALGDANGFVQLADLEGFAAGFERLKGHGDSVRSLALSEDGARLLTASADGVVALWELLSPTGLEQARPHPGFDPAALVRDADGSLLAAENEGGQAIVWRLEGDDWRRYFDLAAATRSIVGAEVFDRPLPEPDAEGFIELEGPEMPVVALAPSGDAVLWTTWKGDLLWSGLPRSERRPRLLSKGDWDEGIAPALSADGNTAAIADADGRAVALYRGLLGTEERQIKTTDAIRSLALSPDGAMVAIGFETGWIGLWSSDATSAGPMAQVQAHSAPVAGLQFTSDGKRLISFASGGGGLDRNVAVSSLPQLDRVRPLRARLPNGAASAISAGRGDGMLSVADNDGRILLVDLSALRFVAEFWAGGSWIPALHLDEGGGTLVAAGSDGVLREWVLRPDDWVALACAKANRSLTPEEWSELRPDDPYNPGCATPNQGTRKGRDTDGGS